jgi:hypothetical protein
MYIEQKSLNNRVIKAEEPGLGRKATPLTRCSRGVPHDERRRNTSGAGVYKHHGVAVLVAEPNPQYVKFATRVYRIHRGVPLEKTKA